MELRGFEPLTFSLRTRRATNCATAPCAGEREGKVTTERSATRIDPIVVTATRQRSGAGDPALLGLGIGRGLRRLLSRARCFAGEGCVGLVVT